MSPIVLFIYNRPSHTKQPLEALSKNTLAQKSDLLMIKEISVVFEYPDNISLTNKGKKKNIIQHL